MIKDVAGERSTTRAILNHAYFEGLDRSDVLNLRLERKFLFQFVFVRDELTQHIQHPTNQHPVSIRSPFRYRLVMVSMFSFCFNSVSRRREGLEVTTALRACRRALQYLLLISGIWFWIVIMVSVAPNKKIFPTAFHKSFMGCLTFHAWKTERSILALQ